jgi:hypothetical protein
MFLVVASVLLCAGLFGCNRQPEAPVAAPQATAVPAPCNCVPPAAAPAPPPAPVVQTAETMRHIRRHHRHTLSEMEAAADESYDQESHTSSYSSSSQTIVQADAVQARKAAWVDGYGRAHYTSDDAAQDENPARLGADDHHLRRSVWRGWNSRCDERGE